MALPISLPKALLAGCAMDLFFNKLLGAGRTGTRGFAAKVLVHTRLHFGLWGSFG